jgi:hypothetical protein
MKNFKYFFLLLLSITFLLNEIKADGNPCSIMFPVNDTSSWGIGFIIVPIKTTLKGSTVETDIPCYLSDRKIRFRNDSVIYMNTKDYIWLNRSSILLKVFEIKDTKYRICANSVSESIWIEFEEFKSKGFDFNTYLLYLQANKNHIPTQNHTSPHWHNIGVNLINSCLNLRTKPNTEGEIITCLLSNDPSNGYRNIHIEILWFSTKGWAYVIAREYVYNEKYDDSGEGCSFDVVKEYRGYVKVVDNDGRPNIWYSYGQY